MIYTYMRREGGVRVRASNRKPTTAGENASRYYSRTSKAFSFHSWELYLPLPTVRRTLLPPSLPVSHPRNAASTLSGFLATREIFLCVSRNASELFEAAEKKPRLDVDVFHVVVVSCKLEKEKKSHLHELLVIPIPLLRRHPLTDASTHNEFIKHREHWLLSRYKKGNSESEGKGTKENDRV